MNKQRTLIALALVVLALFFIFFYAGCSSRASYRTDQGMIFGTTYHIKYRHPQGQDLHQGIIESLREVDASLSMFNDTSVISRINANRSMLTDTHFRSVFRQAQQVSELTHGAFDMTVAPLVNAWGFGRQTDREPTPQLIDSLRQWVGYRLVSMEDGRIIKQHQQTMLDAGAIAKGYGCDVVARYLQQQGCQDYLVEIGGEIVCQGLNDKGEEWIVGINSPADDPGNQNNDLFQRVQLTGCGLATSGNYRQFYIRDGQRRAHTIDPRTGYPVQHDLLSATVVAPTCMQADALATSFMVLGADSALSLTQQLDSVSCYLICSDGADGYIVRQSDDFGKYLR